jgi:hypothetical protein
VITQLLRKWFGLPEPTCASCEILRDQLDESNRERRELLQRVLEKDKSEPLPTPVNVEELRPIRPQHSPWRVRQQMLEAEDRKTAQLMKDKEKELQASRPTTPTDQRIEALEEELGIPQEK